LNPIFDPATIAQSIVEAAAGIAARNSENNTDTTVQRILKSADQYLTVAEQSLAEGQITTAMFALSASDAACRLCDMLLDNDPEAFILAAPWAQPSEAAA
jgi:hypothetical protein